MTRKLLFPALACLLAAVSGCSRNNLGSVQLTELCFPPTPDTNGLCAFSSGTCPQVLADGHLFVDLVTSGGTLEYPIQIDNQRQDNSDEASGRTNTNKAFIERFDMRYEAPGFSLPAASVNQAATAPTGGSTVVVVALIPSSAGVALATAFPDGPTEAVIKVKAHGRYGDDTEFDTAEFAVPVAISKGVVGEYACSDTKKTLAVCPQQGQTAVAVCQ